MKERLDDLKFDPGPEEDLDIPDGPAPEVDLHATTDAVVWAREFCRRFPGSDLGFMIGWFANAIETGRAAGRQEASAT